MTKTAARKQTATKASRAKAAASARPKLRDVKKTPPDRDAPAFAHLRPTETPGVYLNAHGMLTDAKGVLLNGLGAMRAAESDMARAILGKDVETPAEYLKRIALDPSMPVAWRLDAAKAAAPYFDRKTPVAVETKNEDFTLDVAAVAKLPKAEREKLLETLHKMGVRL